MHRSLQGKTSLDVYLCTYYNVMRSIVESLPNEETGFIIGKPRRNGFVISNAYPIITSKRKPTSVNFSDFSIAERLIKFEKALHASTESRILGGYHSHVGENTLNQLSESDFKHISYSLDTSKSPFWIELLVKIESRKGYQKNMPQGEFFYPLAHEPKKLKVEVYDEPRHGYHFTFSGFAIDKEGSVKELQIRRLDRRRN